MVKFRKLEAAVGGENIEVAGNQEMAVEVAHQSHSLVIAVEVHDMELW